LFDRDKIQYPQDMSVIAAGKAKKCEMMLKPSIQGWLLFIRFL